MMQTTQIRTEPTTITSLNVGEPAGLHAVCKSPGELTGTIKWFDVSKGYGFIVPDNGMPDILFDLSCLRRGGFQVIHQGARVVVEAHRRARGLLAVRILSMDPPAPGVDAQLLPAHVRAAVVPTSGLEEARVKWFNRARGFGFLTRGEHTPDIFVHAETIRRFGLTELRPGQAVLVRYGNGPKGLTAAEVRPLGAAQGPALH
jgi:cold shock protein